MKFTSTMDLVLHLEQKGDLVRIKDEVDPLLEMAEIQRRAYRSGGPALFFERVKGSPFPAASNLFGTPERIRNIFRYTMQGVKTIMEFKGDPSLAVKNPLRALSLLPQLYRGLPKRVSARRAPSLWGTTTLDALPGILSWKKDGGRYITLPQVYTEHPDKKGPMGSNLGMYRVQLDGNEYEPREVGLHYQIHRGIGHHHYEHIRRNLPMRVSIFIGGPPAMTVAAVMPLPKDVPEVAFAGLLAGKRFRYALFNGFVVSADADFVITGWIHPGTVKPEGPFGDHLGYYSLVHDMPVMEVESVFYRKDAVWPFTVVGRPPQEDTEFGSFIHEITGPAVPAEVPGLHEVHAVDEAGVHPLLLAIGSDHYVPYMKRSRPAELLTVANGILGSGQLSLAKFLLIAAREDDETLTTRDVKSFFYHVLERIQPDRDIHFHTNTTIDTLDYSGDGLNRGSKVILAASGEPVRKLASRLPEDCTLPSGFSDPRVIIPGVLAVKGPVFEKNENEMDKLTVHLEQVREMEGFPFIVVTDNSRFCAEDFSNFLWVTFTRSNPASDIYGVRSFIENKHWGCRGPLVLDARAKPHHAPPLEEDPEVNQRVGRIIEGYPGIMGKSG